MPRHVAGGTAIITAATIIRSTTITPGTTITTVAAIGIANPGYSPGRTGLTWAIWSRAVGGGWFGTGRQTSAGSLGIIVNVRTLASGEFPVAFETGDADVLAFNAPHRIFAR